MKTEYKEPKAEQTKIYIHKKQHIITAEGDILLLRFSYDKERCFIRSVCLVEPCMNLDGSIGRNYTPLELNLSVVSNEKMEQLLGVEEQK